MPTTRPTPRTAVTPDRLPHASMGRHVMASSNRKPCAHCMDPGRLQASSSVALLLTGECHAVSAGQVSSVTREFLSGQSCFNQRRAGTSPYSPGSCSGPHAAPTP